jgi:Tol biopolymer transport system component
MLSMDEESNTPHEQRLAMSPDGSRIAFVHNDHLWVRDFAKPDAQMLPGTEGADVPAWSPDGTQIAYRVGATFHRIPAGGGSPTVISTTTFAFTGGSGSWWTQDGRIIFSTGGTAIMQVSAMGGDATEFAPLAEDETDVHEPSELPGGRGVLYVAHLENGGPGELRLWADGKRTTLLKLSGQRLWSPRYASSGHILYRRTPANTGVWALPFSLSSLEATGDPFLVAEDGSEPCPGPDGILAYLVGGNEASVEIAILNRDGTLDTKLDGVHSVAGNHAVSPDGRRLATVISESNNGDIWVYDLARGTRTRLTFEPGWDIGPHWSPDGQFIYYTVPTERMTYQVPADGSGQPRRVHAGFAGDISGDGKWLVYDDDVDRRQADVFVMPLPADTSTAARSIVATNANETGPRISPDGRYVAYVSDESGENEIYLTRFPDAGGKWQVSTHGGSRVRWDPAGGKLYYTSRDELMEVEITTAPSLQLGTPRAVFNTNQVRMVLGRTAGYDVFRGAGKFVITYAGENVRRPKLEIVVVENWPAEFRTVQTAKK